MMSQKAFMMTLALVVGAVLGLSPNPLVASAKHHSSNQKIFAQQLMDQAISKHPEVTQIELAVPSPRGCSTIAASDPKGIGEKCDRDELEALRSGKPFVEKERAGFDVTLPLHDVAGKLIGTVGMDFKPQPGQQELIVVEQATKIVQELEVQISSQAKLFEPAPSAAIK